MQIDDERAGQGAGEHGGRRAAAVGIDYGKEREEGRVDVEIGLLQGVGAAAAPLEHEVVRLHAPFLAGVHPNAGLDPQARVIAVAQAQGARQYGRVLKGENRGPSRARSSGRRPGSARC